MTVALPASRPAPAPAPAPEPVTAVVVTFHEVELTLAAVASLRAQTVPVAEIVVVDNDAAGSARDALAAAHPDVRVLVADNVGYAPACNRAAETATGRWLLFLNPDAEAEPSCLARLLEVTRAHPAAGVVAPQVLMADGRTVNAGENRIHLTGITWCGGFGEPPEDGPARPAFVTTGAAMLVRADLYRALGGYCDEFFLFFEDPDLCWRAWLAGAEVWYAPRARVRHHYAWGAGTAKWYHLERNRALAVLTNHRASTLAVLTPLLLATEVALLAVAAREGWWTQKLRAYRAVWARRAWIRERRSRFATLRRRPDAELIGRFEAEIDTPQVTSPLVRLARPVLRAYARAAVATVRRLGR